MPCTYLRSKTTGELLAIVRGTREHARKRRPRCACGEPSNFQCDWKIGAGKTCDKHLCANCGREVAPEKHLCPDHQEAYRQWLARRASRSPQPSPVKEEGVI